MLGPDVHLGGLGRGRAVRDDRRDPGGEPAAEVLGGDDRGGPGRSSLSSSASSATPTPSMPG
ncbi:hypothetical protein ACFWOG_33940, partial [Kitasatospora sp. NPDC058406]|uniref:hypothetical protein n=1 Tax=Kitasatospora sp. NPDC058406 TaxID=3346483 RepID=UPI00364A040F